MGLLNSKVSHFDERMHTCFRSRLNREIHQVSAFLVLQVQQLFWGHQPKLHHLTNTLSEQLWLPACCSQVQGIVAILPGDSQVDIRAVEHGLSQLYCFRASFIAYEVHERSVPNFILHIHHMSLKLFEILVRGLNDALSTVSVSSQVQGCLHFWVS